MFKRLFLVLRSWFRASKELPLDPDEAAQILEDAQREMRWFHEYRQLWVDAITERNLVEKELKYTESLIKKRARRALRSIRRFDYLSAKIHSNEVDRLRKYLERQRRYLAFTKAEVDRCRSEYFDSKWRNSTRGFDALQRRSEEMYRIRADYRESMAGLPKPSQVPATCVVIGLLFLNAVLLDILWLNFLP